MYALAGPVTSIRLALSFHSAMTMAFPGIQPNIVMPMELLLLFMFERRGSTGQFQWSFGLRSEQLFRCL